MLRYKELCPLSYTNQISSKEIAWNGIGVCVPSSWEIGQIGARHLSFEDNSRPTMEIKWGAIKGKFSHRTHLKRLSALQSNALKNTVAEWLLPSAWKKVLSDFQVSGFSWQSQSTSGRGVILYCPTCRNATLIQFFQPKSAKAEKIPLEIFKTFRDHREDNQAIWCIFDIRAILPRNYKLQRHRFEAGRYELEFADGVQKLHLYRWAPAAVLLREQDLLQFSQTIENFSPRNATRGIINGYRSVEWCHGPRYKWFRWMSRLRRKPAYQWGRLWHVEEKNRILGIAMHGKRPLDVHMLNSMCAHYESL